MHRIFTRLAAWLNAFLAAPRMPDPLDGMTPCELADLPPVHPQPERCGA